MTFDEDFTEEDKLFFIRRIAHIVVKKEPKYTAEGKLVVAANATDPACVISMWRRKKGDFRRDTQGGLASVVDGSVRCKNCRKTDAVCVKVENAANESGKRFAISKRD